MIFRHDPIPVGSAFGRWTVVGDAPVRNAGKHYRYLCQCRCGVTRLIVAADLRKGRTRSCGCLARDQLSVRARTHGQTGTPLYRIWSGMMKRCRNSLDKDFHKYGGRGITVCTRWHTFENFHADMPPRPSPTHTIGRIDNDRGYEPGNVRWETPTEQQNNLRSNRRLTYNGETLTVAQWARRLGINNQTIHERIKRGWPIEKVLSPQRFRRTRRSHIDGGVAANAI